MCVCQARLLLHRDGNVFDILQRMNGCVFGNLTSQACSARVYCEADFYAEKSL